MKKETKNIIKRIVVRMIQVFGIILFAAGMGGLLLIKTFTFSTLISPLIFLFSGLFAWLSATFRGRIKKLCRKNRFAKTAAVTSFCLYGAMIIFFMTMSTVIFSYSLEKDIPENLPLIVLGGYVRDDKPARQLRERLDAAYDYLIENPEAKCIVTGGLQEDAIRPQGMVMKEYLVEKGIAAERIIEENQAFDTNENLKFSKEILEENNLGTKVAIATSEYHQFRASLRAKSHGMTSFPVSSKTGEWWVLPQNFVRETFGIIEFAVFG